MNLYDYECGKCGKVELEHSMDTDRDVQSCPNCESKLEALISCIAVPKEFIPYALENGPLYYAETDNHFDSGAGNNGKRCIHIQSKSHEDAVMKKMGCNFGEKGQEVLGFKLGYDKPEKKVHIRR